MKISETECSSIAFIAVCTLPRKKDPHHESCVMIHDTVEQRVNCLFETTANKHHMYNHSQKISFHWLKVKVSKKLLVGTLPESLSSSLIRFATISCNPMSWMVASWQYKWVACCSNVLTVENDKKVLTHWVTIGQIASSSSKVQSRVHAQCTLVSELYFAFFYGTKQVRYFHFREDLLQSLRSLMLPQA